MDFVLVALRSLSAFQAETLVPESKSCHHRTIPADAPAVFRNAEHALSGYAIEQLILFPCTAVVGRTCRTAAYRPLFIHKVFVLLRTFLP